MALNDPEDKEHSQADIANKLTAITRKYTEGRLS